ncbi:hypothetical protein CPB86DRAFT_816868 [Serendipita vermifera]|nr:hypothetical protein CPB86DRAFT_816868 [Serendipita vermifera]
MKRQAVLDLISKREVEIQALRDELRDMEKVANKEISKREERTSKQVQSLKDRIQKILEETDNYIDAREDRLYNEQEPLEQKISSLERANDVSRAAIASIRLAPSEVLGLVFRECVEMNCSVLSLALVSEHWRQIAFATPHLWSAIAITDSGSYSSTKINYNGHTYCSLGKWLLCTNEIDLKAILNLCGTVALHIAIRSNENIPGALSCLKLLDQPNVLKRVTSLEFSGCRRYFMDHWPGSFQSAPLHHLRHLSMDGTVLKRWQDNIFASISETSSVAPSLVTLKCSIHTQSFRRLNFPVLESLEVLATEFSQSVSPPDSVSYPKLTWMKIKTGYMKDLLANISAPELTHLDLDIISPSLRVPYKETSIGSFTALKTLNLTCNVPYDPSNGLLDVIPSLTTLKIAHKRHNKEEEGTLLLSQLIEYEDQFLYCPNLQSLSLGSSDYRVHTQRKSLRPLINGLITARKKNNTRLHKLEVFWKNSTEFQQYVKK